MSRIRSLAVAAGPAFVAVATSDILSAQENPGADGMSSSGVNVILGTDGAEGGSRTQRVSALEAATVAPGARLCATAPEKLVKSDSVRQVDHPPVSDRAVIALEPCAMDSP